VVCVSDLWKASARIGPAGGFLQVIGFHVSEICFLCSQSPVSRPYARSAADTFSNAVSVELESR
jgi:hypothetical protein